MDCLENIGWLISKVVSAGSLKTNTLGGRSMDGLVDVISVVITLRRVSGDFGEDYRTPINGRSCYGSFGTCGLG